MALFSRKNIKNIKSNPFGLTEDDLKGSIKDFPMGVVVRMLEEQELQGNKPNVEVFQQSYSSNKRYGGFDWDETKDRSIFWFGVIEDEDFSMFFKKYPKYEKYNL